MCYLFYRSKLRGIKPYRFRVVLQMIRVIRVICEICGLKKKVNIKLADAVIGATALINNLKLATRNLDDFKKIKGLEVVNPFD